MTLFLCQTRERELTASTSMGSECPREPVSLGLVSRILKPNFASTYVTTSRRASSNVLKRLKLRIKCFSSSSGTNDPRLASLISSSNFVLHRLLVARHVGLPAFDPRLGFQKRAPSRRNDHAQKVSFSSSCRRIISLLQSPPCLQRILLQVGDNVIRLITVRAMSAVCICCSTNIRFCSPLSSFVSVGKNSKSIAVVVISVGCSAAHSNIISDSLITPAKKASVFFDHCWKSSSRPVNSFGRPRPFTSMRLGVSFRT